MLKSIKQSVLPILYQLGNNFIKIFLYPSIYKNNNILFLLLLITMLIATFSLNSGLIFMISNINIFNLCFPIVIYLSMLYFLYLIFNLIVRIYNMHYKMLIYFLINKNNESFTVIIIYYFYNYLCIFISLLILFKIFNNLPIGYNDYLIILSYLISFTLALIYIDNTSENKIFINNISFIDKKYKILSYFHLFFIILIIFLPVLQMYNDFFENIFIKLFNKFNLTNKKLFFLIKILTYNFYDEITGENKQTLVNIQDGKNGFNILNFRNEQAEKERNVQKVANYSFNEPSRENVQEEFRNKPNRKVENNPQQNNFFNEFSEQLKKFCIDQNKIIEERVQKIIEQEKMNNSKNLIKLSEKRKLYPISDTPEIEIEKEAEIQKFKEKDFAEFQKLREEFHDLFYSEDSDKSKENSKEISKEQKIKETSKKIKEISNEILKKRKARETYNFDAVKAFFQQEYDLENRKNEKIFNEIKIQSSNETSNTTENQCDSK
jgi:hypothetical protein